MRRLLLTAAGLVPLVAFLGCNHMAGMCDCDFIPAIPCPCYGHVVAPAPLKPVEPIKEAPKETPNPKPVPQEEEN
jgi:hypothetical protein